MEMTARDIMTANVVTIQASARIYELTKLLGETGMNGFPVCEDDRRVVGYVSEADLFALRKGEWVRDIMAPNIVQVDAETPVEEVAAIFNSYKIETVLVFEDGFMIGIVRQADAVDAMMKRNESNVEKISLKI